MAVDRVVIGQRLRAERESRRWSRVALVSRMREESREPLPETESLAHQIKEWERGKHVPGPIYRALYAAVLGVVEAALFGEEAPTSLWRIGDGLVTPDDEARVTLAVARPARVDAGTIDALRKILAGQRRLEDATGASPLVGPVGAQLDSTVVLLRGAEGPHRGELERIVSEWMTFAGWLHAALRHNEQALRLFALAEDLADESGYGTGAALATSFRGYVARQQGKPRAVIRASSAAMATPGVHRAQRTFDLLQAAQGYADMGDRDAVRRLLDEAANEAPEIGEPPDAVYWYNEPFFNLNIGVALLGIGEYRDAADIIRAGLGGMPPDQRRAEWIREYEHALERADAQS